jgi:hypothetical protein
MSGKTGRVIAGCGEPSAKPGERSAARRTVIWRRSSDAWPPGVGSSARSWPLAHTMLIIAYHMLKNGQTYQELGGTYLEQINKSGSSASS